MGHRSIAGAFAALRACVFGCAAFAALGAPSTATGGDNAAPGGPLYARPAECVAALKHAAAVAIAQVRAGDAGAEPELLALTEAGYSFVAEAYKAGLRQNDAAKILAAAEEAQRALPETNRERLAADCRVEGERLLARAEPFERSTIAAAARRRVKRLKAQS